MREEKWAGGVLMNFVAFLLNSASYHVAGFIHSLLLSPRLWFILQDICSFERIRTFVLHTKLDSDPLSHCLFPTDPHVPSWSYSLE